MSPTERHWEESVLSLEQLCEGWKQKWDGMAFWEERCRIIELRKVVHEREWRVGGIF
jgi:hypothetical protein